MTYDKTACTITTFKITTEVHDAVKKFNQKHPNNKINVSETCREAVEQKLTLRIKQEKPGAKRT